MPVPLAVPDASVVLKWVQPSDDEPDVEKALLLREAILDETVKAIFPGLWLYEVGNTVARRLRLDSCWRSGWERNRLIGGTYSRCVAAIDRNECRGDTAYHPCLDLR
jgi:hypothetical protein